MKDFPIVAVSTLTLLSLTSCNQKKTETVETTQLKPNVIFILADDLGYGDIGCYGQQYIITPNIDRLSAEGLRFTDHYAGCTVSAPSRCTLMTGFHTGHAQIRGNKPASTMGVGALEGQFPMDDSTITVADVFKKAGYQTGAFGKWGLGYPGSVGDPNNQGFDEFWGYNCQREAHRYYPNHIWHNQEKVMLEGNDNKHKVIYAPDVIHKQVLEFIKKNKNKPFFAFVPVIQPHAELVVPDDSILTSYKGKFPEKPYIMQKGSGSDYGDKNFDKMKYCSQPIPHATFAAMVARIDKYVGDIVELVHGLGLDDNTIIIFSSDNGPHQEGGADPDYFNSNGNFRGYKRDVTDGGIRVPFIARWKGHIKPGTETNHVSAFWDFLPTVEDLIGQKEKIPTDGISFLPTLLGKSDQQKEHQVLYWEFKEKGGRQAIRFGNWKALRLNMDKNPEAPIELYDITNDNDEMKNVASEYPAIVKKANELMKEQRTANMNYPFTFEK